jgi:glutamate synthase (NADPH/NADH) small chain
VEHARQAGVNFIWNARPTRFIGSDQIAAIEYEPDLRIECETAIVAIGQSRLLKTLDQISGIELRKGQVIVDAESGQTGNPKYFAGGDCVNGGREVVDAAAEGKRAARGITQWLT